MTTYPFASENRENHPSETSAGFTRKSTPHILIVDDEISIRRLNTLVLLRSGYEVHCAEDGHAAWNALTSDDYDLVITDHEMPKLTGRELFYKMQQAGMELPVIFACGTVPQEGTAEWGSFQPDAILLKPYTIDEMLGTVERVLRKAGMTAWQMYPCF